jgi:hypothetical protein
MIHDLVAWPLGTYQKVLDDYINEKCVLFKLNKIHWNFQL